MTAIDPQLWEDTIQALLETIVELPTVWRDEPRPYTDPNVAAICLLHVPSSVALGQDETRYVEDENEMFSNPPVEISPSQCGLRRTTLTVQIDSYDQDAKRQARRYLERVRTRIRRPSNLAALNNIESSLISISPIFVVPYVRDGRAYSQGTMDLLLHTTVDDPDKPFGRIASFGGTGELRDSSGAVVNTLDYTIQLEPTGD